MATEKNVCGCWVVEKSRMKKKQSKEDKFFRVSERSVMCEIKRLLVPQGEEEDGVSASRWQATVEVKLEVEAVQSA